MEKRNFFQYPVITLLIVLFIISFDNLQAQATVPDSSKKSFRLFEDDELIEVTLQFDLSTYFRKKPKDEYLKANITFHLSETDSITKDIRLRTRGIFRNQFCVFPPIELNFKKVDFGYTDLNRISKLKMVPQCSAGKDREDYVLREYLAYKLFSVLTDTSFRVRLITVNYVDTKKTRKPLRQYGFFIEPLAMLTARTNCVEVESLELTQRSIVPRIMDRMAIFNFMIGNYDWSIPGQHNVQVIKSMIFSSSGLGIVVPYDFDWTGFVNASYAIPAENVGTENVRERLFQGVCRSREVYLKELDLFLEKKEEFYKVINEFPYINEKVKRDLTGYLDEFFDQLGGKKDNILYNFMNTCKKL